MHLCCLCWFSTDAGKSDSNCCCCSVRRVRLCDPMICSSPGRPVLHRLPGFSLRRSDAWKTGMSSLLALGSRVCQQGVGGATLPAGSGGAPTASSSFLGPPEPSHGFSPPCLHLKSHFSPENTGPLTGDHPYLVQPHRKLIIFTSHHPLPREGACKLCPHHQP